MVYSSRPKRASSCCRTYSTKYSATPEKSEREESCSGYAFHRSASVAESRPLSRISVYSVPSFRFTMLGWMFPAPTSGVAFAMFDPTVIAQIAKAVFNAFASGRGDTAESIRGLASATLEGRIRMHMFHDDDQAEIAGTMIAGTNEVGLSFAHVEEVAAASAAELNVRDA